MKFTLILVFCVVPAILLSSCSDDGTGKRPTSHAEDHSSHSASVGLEDGLDGLELDNGRRWMMDDHTRSIFVKMATSFLDSDQRSLEGEGLKKAGSDLQALVNELIQGCTMTGEAHDQLHVYLTGYIPAVAALSKSGRIEDAKKVTRYLEKYDEYFE